MGGGVTQWPPQRGRRPGVESARSGSVACGSHGRSPTPLSLQLDIEAALTKAFGEVDILLTWMQQFYQL